MFFVQLCADDPGRSALVQEQSGHGQQPEALPFQSLTVLPLQVFRQLAVQVHP